MRVFKRLILMMFSLLLCLNLSSLVYAKEVNDNQVGSIELRFNNNKASQISFSLYKIGDVIDGSLVQYVPSSSFSNLEFDLNSITTSRDCEEVMNQCKTLIHNEKIMSLQKVKANSKGNVYFTNLEVGLYFIKQEDQSKEFQSSNILIALPMNDDDNLLYDIVAHPKYFTISENPKEPPQPHTPDEPVVNVFTGDQTNILPIVVSLVISGTIIIILYFSNKRKRDHKD